MNELTKLNKSEVKKLCNQTDKTVDTIIITLQATKEIVKVVAQLMEELK